MRIIIAALGLLILAGMSLTGLALIGWVVYIILSVIWAVLGFMVGG